MNFLMQLLIVVLYSFLFKVEQEEQKAPTIEDVDLPTNSEIRDIPIVYGTNLVKGVNFIFAGDDFESLKMTKKVKTGLLTSDRITVGYNFLLTTAIGIGLGRLELLSMYFNEKKITDFSPRLTGTYLIEEEFLFKTESEDVPFNGVRGEFSFYDGSQFEADDYLVTTFPTKNFSPQKGICYAVFNHFYWGNDGKLAIPDFEVRRIPRIISEGDDYLIINEGSTAHEANPAEILYDVMTEKTFYGIGIQAEDIDTESFTKAAKTLKEEKFGLSIIYQVSSSFEDFSNDICNHISANLFRSNYTGKWKLKLNRKDYNIEDLIVFNESNAKIKYNRKQALNLFNEVKINYEDRSANYQERSSVVDTKTLEFLTDQNNTKKIDFFGIKTSHLAAQVASRELAAYSKNLISLEITCDRIAYGLERGDVIVVNYPRYNINNLVFRIQEINLGRFNDNAIKINCIQDIFSFGIYTSVNNDSTFTRPQFTKYLNHQQYNITSPYAFVKENSNASLFCLTKNSNRDAGFDLYNSSTLLKSQEERTPIARVMNTFDKNVSQISNISIYNDISNLSLLQFETELNRRAGDNLAIIFYKNNPTYHEFISFSDIELITTNNYRLNNVWRGCLDTKPKSFNSTTDEIVIMFFSYANIIESSNSSFELIAKYNNKENQEVLYSISKNNIANRNLLPLLPNNLKVNTVLYQDTQTIGATSNLALTWDYTNRFETANQITKYSDNFITQEANVVYNIKIYDNITNTLIKNIDINSNNYTFSDESPLRTQLRVVVEAKRLTYLSFEKYEFIVNR